MILPNTNQQPTSVISTTAIYKPSTTLYNNRNLQQSFASQQSIAHENPYIDSYNNIFVNNYDTLVPLCINKEIIALSRLDTFKNIRMEEAPGNWEQNKTSSPIIYRILAESLSNKFVLNVSVLYETRSRKKAQSVMKQIFLYEQMKIFHPDNIFIPKQTTNKL